MPFNVFDLTAR